MVYDDVLKVTWLQNANMNGMMTWDNAMTWANNLVYGGYDDWRLPSALNQDGSGPCAGYNCNSSEMGHLYYVDGITPTSMGPFINVQDFVYWSGTEYSPGDPVAWDFGFDDGVQNYGLKNVPFDAWAVRPGDVAAAVPEPATALLFGVGAMGLGLSRRGGRRRR